MGKKTPDYKNWNAWTTARFWTFLRSALRVAWNKYPPKYAALKNASVGKQINKDTDRLAEHFRCNECQDCFPAKKVQVDHIHDAGTLKDYSDLPRFVERLFCSVNELQILCKPCHAKKTKEAKEASKCTKSKTKQSSLLFDDEILQ
ncbi:MAG: HNH endonuclease signature motif containing protein [Bacteroidales bacterium]